ncbi:MAG TPA: HEAT repeat domain-containing protein [Gammaproteobacteria bacterium]|nr:HEAT repeat domain-containing protein [Gammaproteobacteria bacterium]
MNTPANAPPDALLLLTSRCPHCPTVLQGLAELVKQGLIGRLEAVNIEARPDIARQYGVRSVPWFRIGDFELEGLHSPAELRQWAQRAATPAGIGEYYTELFKSGQLAKALSSVHRNPHHLEALLELMADPDTELTVRIGISAVMEDLAGSEALRAQLPTLLALATHDDPRVRADTSHFLALTRSRAALEALKKLAQDPERAVSNLARDSLEELEQQLNGS